MANKRSTSGAKEIINAEELFRKSVSANKPDYRYVALAIGQNAVVPPRWAIIECILARKAAEGAPSLKPTIRAGEILDQIIVEFVAHKDEWDIKQARYERMIHDGRRIRVLKPEPFKELSFAEACRRAWRLRSNSRAELTRKEIEKYQNALDL